MPTLEEKAEKLQSMVDERFTPEQRQCLDKAKEDLRRFVKSYGNYAQLAMSLVAAENMAAFPVHEPIVAYGCHLEVDVAGGDTPDECYIDTGKPSDCCLADSGEVKCKTECPHWKPYTVIPQAQA